MPRHKPQQTYVTANTSSCAGTDGFLSSFQRPGLAGMAMPPEPYKPLIDRSAASTLSTPINHDNFVVGSVRSSSLSNPQRMGLGQSKHAQPRPLPSPKSATPSQVLDDATSPTAPTKGNKLNGNRLKRSFVVQGQVSDDLTSTAAKARELSVTEKRPLPQIPTTSAEHSTMSIHTQHPSSTIKVLEKPLVISPTNTSAPLSSVSPLDCPEVPSKLLSSTSTAVSQEPLPSLLDAPLNPSNRNSVMPISPGISSAVNFMMMEWQQQGPPKQELDTPVATATLSSSTTSLSSPICEGESTPTMVHRDMDKEKESVKRHSGGSGSASPDKREMKESWRKSDSTNSHHTVRQNSARSSRPVSWAESFHSAYTIIPSPGAPQLPTSKRLSALITDADFGMPEEEVEEVDDDQLGVEDALAAASLANPNPGLSEAKAQIPPSVPSKDSIRKVNRRSISLSSALPSTVVNFLVGGANGKPSQAHPRQVVPPTSISAAASASTADLRKVSHSISGSEGLAPQNHRHQPLLHSLTPSSYTNYRAPFMSSFSPSQPPTSYTNFSQPQQLSTTSSLKGKLQSFLPALPKGEQRLPALPSSPANSLGPSYSTGPGSATPSTSHHRQPTLSGLGPSAAGIAKRAVERMGKRLGWGDMMSGLSSSNSSVIAPLSSGNSSTTSVSTSMTSGFSNYQAPWADGGVIKSGFGPGSTQVQGPYGLVRTGSRGSNGVSVSGHGHHHSVVHTFLPGPSKPGGGGHKRTPNAKSLGATTVMGDFSTNTASSSTLALTSVSASTSESDPFNASGPMLGRRLRAPLRNGRGLFGKELKTVVKETRIVREEAPNVREGLVKELEERVLPALVVRCAQHLLIWGVQEEGLFRVNGRPRHVSRLRAEFETGVDYDMTECSPGDLDPHAVASVFKAFLRELPDSILTQKLQPCFDAAIYKENSTIASEQMSMPQLSSKSGKGLPSNPKGGFNINSLRKPPSLSTLAMPTFNQVPAPSKSLVNAIRSLIAQLPSENRDLIRTVVDLIKATAEGSKATKMPLSNLLVVFCPSLNMSPPLLRVLCEADGLWIEQDKVIDIKREANADLVDDDDDLPPATPEKDRVINISRDDLENDDLETRSGLDEESSLLSSSSLDYHASAEESSISEGRLPRRRKEVLDRPKIPTVYLDTKSYLSSSSSIASLQDPIEVCQHESRFSQRHDSRDDGSVSSDASFNNNLRRCHSPPPLSTSAESVSTPTSSANGSFLNLPLEGTEMPKDMDLQRNEHDLPSVRASPQIVGSEPMELRKRPLISNPIPITGSMQFPFPSTPTKDSFTPPTASRRRSIPLLSLSSLSSQSSSTQQTRESPSGSPGQAEFRAKKPSLRLLFSKKSASSFFEDKEKVVGSTFSSSQLSQYLQDQLSPRAGSDSSISTPLSAVTAPQRTSSGGVSVSGSVKDLPPPVLDTLIEDSSFKIDDFLNAKSSSSHDDLPKTEESFPPPESTRSSSNKPVQKNLTLQGLDPSITTSPRSVKKSDTQRQRQPPSQPTAGSIDKKDEDWMRSVLRAADAAGGFSRT